MDIGMKAKKSLASRYGTQYEVGNIVDVICKYLRNNFYSSINCVICFNRRRS